MIVAIQSARACWGKISIAAALAFAMTNGRAQPTINFIYPPTLSDLDGPHDKNERFVTVLELLLIRRKVLSKWRLLRK